MKIPRAEASTRDLFEALPEKMPAAKKKAAAKATTQKATPQKAVSKKK